MPRCFSLVLLATAVACGPAGTTGGGADTVDAEDHDWAIYDGSLPSEFPLSVGQYWPAGAEFAALVDGQDMEIVQGIQGGVHTEIALEFDLGFGRDNTATIQFDLYIQTLLDGADAVATLELDGFKADNVGFGVFRTHTLPVIFDQNEAVHYEGRQAVIVVQVTMDGEVSGHAAPVMLVDTRNDLEDLEDR